MKNFMKQLAKNSTEKIYKTFESSSGNMILITTATGVLLSSLAQSLAIVFNKKYTVSQKAFMIPQEITEGAISVCSLVITSLILKTSAQKCVESGKIITKDLKGYLKKENALNNIGTPKYSVTETINKIKDNIQKTDEFIKGSSEVRKSLVSQNENALILHEQTKDATSAIVTTAGSIISTAIIVPVIRNCVASKFQPRNIELINDVRSKKYQQAKQPLTTINYTNYNGMRV